LPILEATPEEVLTSPKGRGEKGKERKTPLAGEKEKGRGKSLFREKGG